ncbi:hypothetical protein NDU88_001426 [Pleurodeles waltl]|uniref:Uncharacterized protein n=1 Tax=Pleurodeles waltl TaxID=8319 RepID=A0AAV7LAY0_PLEWA|nr:hypothetical protein NDU88_001426 [Pleurodeles waltl]
MDVYTRSCLRCRSRVYAGQFSSLLYVRRSAGARGSEVCQRAELGARPRTPQSAQGALRHRAFSCGAEGAVAARQHPPVRRRLEEAFPQCLAPPSLAILPGGERSEQFEFDFPSV